MDTGNQGLCLALSSLRRLWVSKGLLSNDEIEQALSQADAGAENDDRFIETLSPPQRDAVTFPIRFLHEANALDASSSLSFIELAKTVGENKKPITTSDDIWR